MSEISEMTGQVLEMDLHADNDGNETSSDSEDEIRVAKVFQNPSIIEKIYENVRSYEDRKSCLRINSYWYKECAGKFQQEGIVNFKSLEDVKEFTDMLSNRLLKMSHTGFRFDTSINLCASVEILAGNDGGGDVAGGMDEGTIIGKFLNKYATKIKRLEAGVVWRSTEELAACLNQFVNLEDFTFYFFKTATPFEFPHEGEITLPKVKKLSVFYHFEDIGERGKTTYKVGEQLMPFIPCGFPAMEYFSFRKWRKYEVPPRFLPGVESDYNSHFELHMLFLISFNYEFDEAVKRRLDSGHQNLKGIVMEHWHLPFESTFNPRCQLPYTLEHMELFNPYWLPLGCTWNQDTLSNLTSFFRVHGSTLRVFKSHITLYLHIQSENDPSPFSDQIIRIRLEFLPLPQLEKLDLIFEDDMEAMGRRFVKIENDWPIEFPALSYSAMFPKLNKLNLTIQAKEEHLLWVQNIHDHFIPSDAEFEEIEVNLKIWVVIPPNYPENEEFRHESWSTPLMDRMSNHPNVVMKEIFALKERDASF